MNYELIKKVIDFMPSKDLRMSYKEDILDGTYPKWTEEECLAIVNMCTHNVREEVNYYKQVTSLIEDSQIRDSIIKWINERMHRGKKYRNDIMPDFIEKYVKVKTLYKGGELVNRWWCGKRFYGVIAIRNYDETESRLKDIMDYSDVCYLCYDIGDWKVDFDNPYDIFGSHSHPMKVNVELADISELNEKEKKYYDVILNKYLYCDEKKIFEEYDRKHVNNKKIVSLKQ